MKEFNIGDKAAAYDAYGRRVGVVDAISTVGMIRLDRWSHWFHPKQCRRLKPRKKPAERVEPERIERWMHIEGWGLGGSNTYFTTPNEAGAVAAQIYPRTVRTVHLVELRPGEVPMDRAKLARAYGKAFGESVGDRAEDRCAFKVMSAALGLEEKP